MTRLKTHGNDYARRVWLATAPEVGAGGRPREGDDIGVFKRFVIDVYEHKRYYREPTLVGDSCAGKDVVDIAPPTVKQCTPQPKPASVAVDLLDFGAFDAAAPAPAPNPTAPAISQGAPIMKRKSTGTPKSNPTAVDLLDFGAFGTAAAPPIPKAPAIPQGEGAPTTTRTDILEEQLFDPFHNNDNRVINGNCNSQSRDTNKVSLFPAPSSPSTPASNFNNSSFDPFGGDSNSNNILKSTEASTSSTAMQPTSSQTVVMEPHSYSGTVNCHNSGSGMMMTNLANGHSMNRTMNNGIGNSMMMNGDSMNRTMNSGIGNSMMMYGGAAMNGILHTTGASGMMNSSSMNNTAMMGNGGMMNGDTRNISTHNINLNTMMMNSNGSGSSSFMAASSGPQQPQHPTAPPQLAMNTNVMQPNKISNSFRTGFGVMSSSTKVSSPGRQAAGGSRGSSALNTQKPDPFAGLGF